MLIVVKNPKDVVIVIGEVPGTFTLGIGTLGVGTLRLRLGVDNLGRDTDIEVEGTWIVIEVPGTLAVTVAPALTPAPSVAPCPGMPTGAPTPRGPAATLVAKAPKKARTAGW